MLSLYFLLTLVSFFILVNPEVFNYRGKTLMATGYFMEALMDFSVAIMLERKLIKEKKDAQEKQGTLFTAKDKDNRL